MNDPHTLVVGVIFRPLSQSPEWTLTTWTSNTWIHRRGKKTKQKPYFNDTFWKVRKFCDMNPEALITNTCKKREVMFANVASILN